MGMILRIASSRIVGQGDIVGRSGYFSLNLSANSVMRGRLDARRTLKSLVADLRESIKNTETPIIVENIVNDIDNQIISIVRNFNDAFKTITGKREVQKQLRSILWLKYKIKDQEVFDKAYRYIEMYY